jgi:hypothetical protein
MQLAFKRNLPLLWAFTMFVVLLADPHLLDYDLTVLVLPGLLLVGALSDAPWWIAGMFLVTLVDLPLPFGPANLQLGVLMLAALALRLWWRLERAGDARLLQQPLPDLAEIPLRGVVYAAS